MSWEQLWIIKSSPLDPRIPSAIKQSDPFLNTYALFIIRSIVGILWQREICGGFSCCSTPFEDRSSNTIIVMRNCGTTYRKSSLCSFSQAEFSFSITEEDAREVCHGNIRMNM